MSDAESPEIAERFARLTAVLEDAAGFAVEGQGGRQSSNRALELCGHIRALLLAATIELVAIEWQLARDTGSGHTPQNGLD